MPLRTPGERLRAARLEKKLSANELSATTGITERALRAHESGQNGIRPEVAQVYADALGVTPNWILFGIRHDCPLGSAVQMVPILGTTQAGTFTETQDVDEPDWFPFPEPGYQNCYALRVAGPCFYPDDTVVLIADVKEAGVREHDLVVVKRTHGRLVETSLKEVRLGRGGRIELWPGPLLLEKDVEIAGVVIASYSKRPARTGPSLPVPGLRETHPSPKRKGRRG